MQTVNVVRFCPLGVMLASAGDDGNIMLWKERAARGTAFGEQPAAPSQRGANQTEWAPVCVLRGHCEDVYDLAWSPRADSLFSGCVDGSSIVWNLNKAKPMQTLREHESYVQGVAWDPVDEFLVSISCDRTARVYASDKAQLQLKKAKKAKPAADGAAVAATSEEASARSFCMHTVLAKRTHSVLNAALNAAPEAAAKAEDAKGAEGGRAAESGLEELGAAAGEGQAAEALEAAETDVPEADQPTAEQTTEQAAEQAAPVAAAAEGTAGPSAAGSGADAAAAAVVAKAAAKAARGPTKVHLFCEEHGSFYRRPCWAPDGSFLLLPSGQYFEGPPSSPSLPTTYLFSRADLAKLSPVPCAHLPSPDKHIIAVRCCPVLFEHSAPAAPDAPNAPDTPESAAPSADVAAPVPDAAGEAGLNAADAAAAQSDAPPAAEFAAAPSGAAECGWMGALPYRVLWAAATLDSIIVYDSASKAPLLIASHMHYAPLTDLAWLPDGHGLLASSMDGYCTIMRFKPRSLGKPLPKEQYPSCMQRKAERPIEKPAAPAAQVAAAAAALPATPVAPAAPAVATGDGLLPAPMETEAAAVQAGPRRIQAVMTHTIDGGAPAGPRRIQAVMTHTIDGGAPTAPTAAEGTAEQPAAADPAPKKRRIQAIMTHSIDGASTVGSIDSASTAGSSAACSAPPFPLAPAAAFGAAAPAEASAATSTKAAATAATAATAAAPAPAGPRRIQAVMTHTIDGATPGDGGAFGSDAS